MKLTKSESATLTKLVEKVSKPDPKKPAPKTVMADTTTPRAEDPDPKKPAPKTAVKKAAAAKPKATKTTKPATKKK